MSRMLPLVLFGEALQGFSLESPASSFAVTLELELTSLRYFGFHLDYWQPTSISYKQVTLHDSYSPTHNVTREHEGN